MGKSVYFQGGTLVLDGFVEADKLSAPLKWIKSHWRCEGYHYASLREGFGVQDIHDSVPRWGHPKLTLHDQRQPHVYQVEALKAWESAQRRGSIVLPTGAGKTFVAIHAIHDAQCSALVVAPTKDLLHQWYARLSNAFCCDVGVYYGAEKNVLPLTVTTYHSAGDLVAQQGNVFKLIIFDEVHHLPAPNWGETALMAPSPFRLGLTATYPEAQEQTDGRWNLNELVGPIVYMQEADDLAGAQLAAYRTERVRINLTSQEQERYDTDFAIYAAFFRTRQLQKNFGAKWWQELMRLSSYDPQARRAFLAHQRLSRLLAEAEGKFETLDQLLREHLGELILIFCDNNNVVYQVSDRHFIPAITSKTNAAERKRVLEQFNAGKYRALVTCEVLNEGIDVPDAKVAIVLTGTSNSREYVQRLGRVLRKVENRQAMLYEIVARGTIEERKAQSRKRKKAYATG